jgi:para-nitrobenzyl esterase
MRIGMKIASFLVLVVFVMGLSTVVYADSLTVKTEQGKVHGKTINDGKVKAFLGLPYAAAPVGDLRWKETQPPAKWKGTRDAASFGARCIQGSVFEDMVFRDGGASEDCLFLNVYAPAEAKTSSKLPVMFWIHGGGYAGGASSEPRHNGDFLPTKGVVLVTINYRLGVFGFLATADLAKEANGAAGNYGIFDMVAALRWVQANIGNFGGDPKNVTIFGESAGSFAVSTLVASPLAQGPVCESDRRERRGLCRYAVEPAPWKRKRRSRMASGWLRWASSRWRNCAPCPLPGFWKRPRAFTLLSVVRWPASH